MIAKQFTISALEDQSAHVIGSGSKAEVEKLFSEKHPVRKLIRKADRSGGFAHGSYTIDGEWFHVVVAVKRVEK